MKAVCVFLVGVAVGWMLMPRMEPELIVELEPILPEPGHLDLAPWLWLRPDGSVSWSRPQ